MKTEFGVHLSGRLVGRCYQHMIALPKCLWLVLVFSMLLEGCGSSPNARVKADQSNYQAQLAKLTNTQRQIISAVIAKLPASERSTFQARLNSRISADYALGLRTLLSGLSRDELYRLGLGSGVHQSEGGRDQQYLFLVQFGDECAEARQYIKSKTLDPSLKFDYDFNHGQTRLYVDQEHFIMTYLHLLRDRPRAGPASNLEFWSLLPFPFEFPSVESAQRVIVKSILSLDGAYAAQASLKGLVSLDHEEYQAKLGRLLSLASESDRVSLQVYGYSATKSADEQSWLVATHGIEGPGAEFVRSRLKTLLLKTFETTNCFRCPSIYVKASDFPRAVVALSRPKPDDVTLWCWELQAYPFKGSTTERE